MGKYIVRIMTLGLLAAFALVTVANAADAPATTDQKDVATVRTDGGVIMLSQQNGPFVTATPDQPAASGDRLLVSKDSIATVIYNDGCEQKYDKPGIYKIAPSCKRAAAIFSTGGGPHFWTTGQVMAAGFGGGLLGALIDRQFCNCKCPPVSR